MNNNNHNKIMDKTGATDRVGVAGDSARKAEASDGDVVPGRASDRRVTDTDRRVTDTDRRVTDTGRKVTDTALDKSKTIGRGAGRRTRAANRVLGRKARALTRDTDPFRDMVSALGRAYGAGVVSTASVSVQVSEAEDSIKASGAGEIVLNSPKKTRLPF